MKSIVRIGAIIAMSIRRSSISSVLFLSTTQADIVDDIFAPARSRNTIINLGQDKDAVGAAVFGGGVEIVIGGDDPIQPGGGLLVDLTQALLRLTLILGVTMTIRNGIKFVMALGDGGKQKAAAKHIGYIALGVILALGSVAIIYLLTSIGKSLF